MTDTARRAMEWLLSNDSGVSSEAICAWMLGGARPPSGSYPRDPADLGRCLRLLERVPEWQSRMPEMAQFGPHWSGLVARWDEIAASMVNEVGIRWEKGRQAPRTYRLMRSILDPIDDAEPGWTDNGQGVRVRSRRDVH